jgi:hypothetical protein
MPAFSATVAPPHPSSTRWPGRAWYFPTRLWRAMSLGAHRGTVQSAVSCASLAISGMWMWFFPVISRRAPSLWCPPPMDCTFPPTPLEPNHVYHLDREGEALLTRSRRSELAGASCHDRSVLLGRRGDFDCLVFYPLLLNLTFFGYALPGNGISFTSGGHTDLRRGANHGSNE